MEISMITHGLFFKKFKSFELKCEQYENELNEQYENTHKSVFNSICSIGFPYSLCKSPMWIMKREIQLLTII